MVPFYGQGLNCGLEDVRVLTSIMVSHGLPGAVSTDPGSNMDEALAACLDEYTETRHKDLVAICDLAMQN